MRKFFTPFSTRLKILTLCALFSILALGVPLFGQASDANPASMRKALKKYNVTVRVFDPGQGSDAGQQYVLPVDSPDAEHAISAAMSNAVAFTMKTSGTSILPVAFTCVGVAERK